MTDEAYREALDTRAGAVTVVPFLADGRVAVGGTGSLPEAAVPAGEHWALAAGRAVRSTGASMRSLHPFLVRGDRVVAWADAVREGPGPAMAVVDAGPLAALAAAARAALTDEAWFRDVRILLEPHYLAADDPYAQSGKSGGAASWELARAFVVDALHRDGTFLDLGCANGMLMESVVVWARERRGLAIEPYGLDISPGLADLARRRLPRWADRVWVGNAWEWEPPRRFDFAHAMTDLVPDHLRARWVDRLLRRFLTPGGRLILRWGDPYPADPDRRTLPDLLAEAGVTPDGELVQERPGRPAVRAAWLKARPSLLAGEEAGD
ncbi:MAG TPA: class I SAM-dependent methyltransferase [Candidatus Dormibacteraeota bacterium]